MDVQKRDDLKAKLSVPAEAYVPEAITRQHDAPVLVGWWDSTSAVDHLRDRGI
jgi:hypothetical protein